MPTKRMTRLLAAVCVVCGFLTALAPADERQEGQANARPLIIGTYNVHVFRGLDGNVDIARIAKLIASQKPDFIGLQEIDCLTLRTGKVDQLAELQRQTGLSGRFGKSIDFQGGAYGLGFLTSGEIIEYRHALLPEVPGRERRSYQLVHLELQGGRRLWVLNTHLGLDSDERRGQVDAILEAVEDLADPVVLLGDFNELPSGEACAAFQKDFDQKAAELIDGEPHQGETFPSNKPDREIDHIWLRRGDGLTIDRSWVLKTEASDHLPLFSELK